MKNASSCFNPHSNRVKLKPFGGTVLGEQVSEVEADFPARANAGAGAIPLVEPGSEFLFAIKFLLGQLPVCGAGFGVFPVNGFWLCGNFGLTEAAKAAETVHKAFRPLGLAIVNPFVKNCPTTQNRRYLAVDWQDRIKFTSPAASIRGFETGPA
jgi:hypothetical protein